MSTILKALQRLERDRTDRTNRSLRDEVVSQGEARQTKRLPRLLPVFAGVGVGALCGAGVLWIVAGRVAMPMKPTSQSEQASVAVHPKVTESRVRPTPAHPRASEPAQAPIDPVPDTKGFDQVPRQAVRLATPPSRELVRPAPSRSVASKVTPAPAPLAAVPAKTQPPAPTIVPERVEPSRSIEVSPPQPFPSVFVHKTLWHPQPSQRLAYVSMPPGTPAFEVREGDVLGSMIVLTIEPSSVLFGREGVELRKRIGE